MCPVTNTGQVARREVTYADNTHAIPCRNSVSVSLSLAVLLLASSAPAVLMAQSVVSDGGTATTISVGATGLVTVEIAPADSASISHNTYSAFSVPAAGVNLNNESVQAGTIINEVTSTNHTLIEGPLTVIGPKADVIIANPNGIAVNGGRFQNTGNVALTTGTLGRTSNDQVAATVTRGAIDIGPDGLSGTMQELALISKSLRIAGGLRYDATEAGAHLNAIVGTSSVSFDRLRGGFGQGGTGQLPWAIATNGGTGATDAVIVDITGDGSVSAGRISVTVTDQGAGVRFAGDQLATAGGFQLTSSGKLELNQSRIAAQGSVSVTADSVELASDATSRAEITSEVSGVVINAQAGDINLGQGRIQGRLVASDNLASSGGVTLTATGDILAASNGDRGAELVSDAGDLANAQRSSNIVMTAEGALRLDGLSLRSTDDVRLSAIGSVSFSNVTGDIGGDLRVFSDAALSFDASVLAAQSDIRLDGTELRFGSADPEQDRTALKAVDGGFTMRAIDGDILNFGSLLQGRTAASGDIESLGGLTAYSSGAFVNRSLSGDRLAVVFGEDDDLHIEAEGDVRNETGRLFSNAGIHIKAGGDIWNETRFTTALAPLTVEQSQGHRFAGSLFLKRTRNTEVSGDFGDQAIAGEQSFILGIEDVTLDAKNIYNVGADITGANVSLNASDLVSSDARQVGQVDFRQSCKWFCRTSGSSTLRFVGGTITASEALSITAGEKLSSIAGRMTGADGIRISAPLTELTPTYSLQLIERPAGLTGWFSGRYGYLSGDYSLGTLQSTEGKITISGDADLGTAALYAKDDVVISGSRIETAPPTRPMLFERRPIGLFWNVFD